MQINRCFEMIYLLLDKKKITAKELAGHFEVSIRTIYRDIEVLSQAGVPIYADRGKGGGIALWDHYILNKVFFSKEEKEEITALLSGMKATGIQENSEALQKIASFFGQPEHSWIEADFARWSNTAQQKELFENIKQAILHYQILEFTYHTLQGNCARRKVEPLKLIFRGQDWYLLGYCRYRKAERFFKIMRMRDIEFLAEHFMPRLITSSTLPQEIVYSKIQVKVKVKTAALARLLDDNWDLPVELQEDGRYTAEIEFPDQGWALSYLLSFEENLEVIEPLSLRKDMIKKLNEIQKIYQS